MRTWRHKKKTDARAGIGQHARLILIILTLISVYGVFILVKPFIHAIIFALLLATIFHPVHQWLLARVKDRENVAAFLAVALVLVLVVVPVSLFTVALVRQGTETFQKANAWFAAGKFQEALQSPRIQSILTHDKVARLRELAAQHLPKLDVDRFSPGRMLLQLSQAALEFIGNRIVPILQAGGVLIVKFLIMLVIMFFFFRDGKRILAQILHLSPLSGTQEQAVLRKIREVSRAVFFGVFLTAVIQAVLGMIAFRIVSIPALLWGTLLGCASLIPAVGTGLIWVPAVAYLLMIGRFDAAAFLALWSMLIIGSVDNIVRPAFMGGKAGMSYLVVFLAILGGIQCFGPKGIIYGPLIFGLCAVCLYIYEVENADFLAQQDRR